MADAMVVVNDLTFWGSLQQIMRAKHSCLLDDQKFKNDFGRQMGSPFSWIWNVNAASEFWPRTIINIPIDNATWWPVPVCF